MIHPIHVLLFGGCMNGSIDVYRGHEHLLGNRWLFHLPRQVLCAAKDDEGEDIAFIGNGRAAGGP